MSLCDMNVYRQELFQCYVSLSTLTFFSHDVLPHTSENYAKN